MEWLWTDGRNSGNSKTGKIPTAYPASRDDAWRSCEGCQLRNTTRPLTVEKGRARFYIDAEHPTCYFWSGLGRVGNERMREAARKGKDYTLSGALKRRRKDVRAVRMSGGGDPSSTPREAYKRLERQVRKTGLAWLDYTHFWQSAKGAWLRGRAMASCDTWEQAVTAVKAGWRAAVHLPPSQLAADVSHGRRDGIKYVVCPAQRKKTVTCNTCRLCDAAKNIVPIIVFRNH